MVAENTIYTLPKGWIRTTIGEILILEYGKSLPQRLRVENGKYPVYGSNGKVGTHNDFCVKGPVIIIGRKGSIGNVHFEYKNCWPIDTTYYITSIKSLSQKFIYYLFKNLRLERLDSSTAVPGINRNSIYEIKIGLPPIVEQHRIVAKIEELFSELDHAEIGLKKAQKQLIVYRQALLKSAFEGKLTKKWRKDNIHTIGFNLIEDEYSFSKNLPIGWTLISLGSIAQITMGQSPPGNTYNSIGKGTPLINGPMEFNKSPFSKTKKGKWTTSPIRTCNEGDLLICVRGSTTGRQNFAGFDASIGRGVAAIHTPEITTTNYLAYFIHFSERMIYEMGTGSTFPSISKEQISNILIPMCLEKEQYQIVQELEMGFTLIENLENSIIAERRKIEIFRLAILRKAFEGKLVNQNLDDEPAKALLGKILNEKKNNLEKVVQNSAPKKKAMKKRALSEILSENFVNKEFSFDEIKSKTLLSYEELKIELYQLLDERKILETVFNEKLQKIQFKLKS